jgi:DNA-binding PadR family transcriptional regulator
MRATLTRVLVLRQFSDGRERYGLELVKDMGMVSATVYPLLHWMEREGLITARRETADAKIIQRPVRTYYTITPAGMAWLRDVESRYRVKVLDGDL